MVLCFLQKPPGLLISKYQAGQKCFKYFLCFSFPPSLTMMHLCITQCTYWMPLAKILIYLIHLNGLMFPGETARPSHLQISGGPEVARVALRRRAIDGTLFCGNVAEKRGDACLLFGG